MKSREDVPQRIRNTIPGVLAAAELAWSRLRVHTLTRLFVRLLPRVLLLVGLVTQCVLLLCIGYMVDLSVSLMELWAELARKHLELTI